jgi:hypothetical protein
VTALFGRAAELARLRPWLAEAVGGLPRVVVCSGKEGIGKTRLLEAFSDAAESVGRRCSGRGRWRLASTPPYWLWEQLFGLDAVASLRMRSSGWLRSEKGGAAVPSVQSETTDPRSAESAS